MSLTDTPHWPTRSTWLRSRSGPSRSSQVRCGPRTRGGRYWGWDPKETWAFITWVLYAARLHALSTTGWRRRSSWLAVAGFLAFVFNFFGVNMWITGLHSYAGV